MGNGFMVNKSKKSQSKIRLAIDNLLEGNFFNGGKTPTEVVKRLAQKGFTVKGKQISMVSRMLTQICQDPNSGLEREEIPQEKRIEQEKWMFKKVK